MKYFKTVFTIRNNDDSRPNDEAMSTARELCAAIAGYVGYESFEDTEDGINGYVQQNNFDEQALKLSFTEFPLEGIGISYTTSVAEDKNWNEQWEKEGFSPIVFGEKCIIHDIYHEVSKQYPINIEIDAKLAFGTGTHNTTRMIVDQLLKMDLHGKKVLDCGCGTGILSIVAAKSGAKEVFAYDIDEWSVENSKHNACINHVTNMTVMQGDVNILKSIDISFDIVLANINRNILVNDMPSMTTKMHKGTAFIISGFYEEDVEILKRKAEELDLEFVCKKSSDNWTMVTFKKK